MNDNDLMPFGIHQGEKMANIPASYFLHLHRQGNISHEGVREYIKENLDVFKVEMEREENSKQYYDPYYNQ